MGQRKKCGRGTEESRRSGPSRDFCASVSIGAPRHKAPERCRVFQGRGLCRKDDNDNNLAWPNQLSSPQLKRVWYNASMSFPLPGFSGSPSTPNRKNNRSLFSQPSTTPAGPPPSYLSHVSTTPAGPPPRSVFGSSYNAANNTFGRRGNTPGRRGFAVPESSPPLNERDEDEDEDAEGDEDDGMDGVRGQAALSPNKSAFMSSIMSSPRGLKRSRNGKVREPTESDYPSIARGMPGRATPVRLEEADDILLQQEEMVSRMDDLAAAQPNERDASITEGITTLTRLWQRRSDTTTKEGRLGPASDDALTRATYLSSLLLQLHHPHSAKHAQRPSRLQPPTSIRKQANPSSCTIPRGLLDWLDTWHHPFPDDFDTIWRNQPSPARHERFWDAVLFALTRGKFDHAIKLLREAGWEHAVTAEDDFGEDHEGYSGRQLDHIEDAVERCTGLLENCPGLKHGDWDIKGGDWTVFRQRVRKAIKELESFAGETDEEADDATGPKPNMFHMSAGMGESMSMSTASRKAGSKVPWSIYENLKLLYGILLGGSDELLDASQDWLEASIYLTVWWDGEDDAAHGLIKSQNLRRSVHSQKIREVDIAPSAAYRKRLADAFALVTAAGDDAVFQPDTLDPVQVGLACLMVDSVESVIGILRTWSLPVTAALVEIAALGGWLPQARPRSKGLLEQGFSSEDLMVLSHGAGQQQPRAGEVGRDDVLSEFADLLAEKAVLKSNDGKVEREGWELAVAVLGRLGDVSAGQSKIGELLGGIELSEEARVDKVLDACRNLELVEQARAIAEVSLTNTTVARYEIHSDIDNHSQRYADGLASSTGTYGPALMYYARAHATSKLKSTLALLTSMSLLHSAAVPTEQDLDPHLASLLSKERTALVSLAHTDTEAAGLLGSHLSGYATLRRFYDLRDQDVTSGKGALRPLDRKREAAKALLAVTSSASDCIRGGLYDPNTESVVPVDGVLALLSEALPLLGQAKRIFSKEQIFNLLRIVEDYATAPTRLRENAESLLQASLNAYRDGGKVSMSGLLKKSRSDLSSSKAGLGGSSYDMLASSVMVQSQEKGKKAAGVPRAWDWRKGLDGLGGGVDVGEKEVLALLRAALAQEVARGWGGVISW